LMENYRCSRMTVNKVLAGLASEGLIERRRRAGSFVARPRVHSAVLEIPDLRVVVEQRGEKYRYSLASLQKRIAGRDDGARIAIPVRTYILEVLCRHEADGRPFALEDRLINLDAVPEAESEDFSLTPPSAWLVSHVPWTQAEHRISAVNADKATAAELGIPVGFACLVLERWTWRNGEPITAVRLTHPGNLYDLAARFTPSSVDQREVAA
jgi:GntR family transcriptional regulator, histidine utilization repressor